MSDTPATAHTFDSIRALAWREQAAIMAEVTDPLVVEAVLVAERVRAPVRPSIISACEQRLTELAAGSAAPPVREADAAETNPGPGEEDVASSEGGDSPPSDPGVSAPAAESPAPPAPSAPPAEKLAPPPAAPVEKAVTTPPPLAPLAARPVVPRAVPSVERGVATRTRTVFALVPRPKSVRHGTTVVHLEPGKRVEVPESVANHLVEKKLGRFV